MNFLIALFVPSKGGRHSHRVTDQGRVLQAVLDEELGDVLGHSGVVVSRGVGGFPVVTQVLVKREGQKGLGCRRATLRRS